MLRVIGLLLVVASAFGALLYLEHLELREWEQVRQNEASIVSQLENQYPMIQEFNTHFTNDSHEISQWSDKYKPEYKWGLGKKHFYDNRLLVEYSVAFNLDANYAQVMESGDFFVRAMAVSDIRRSADGSVTGYSCGTIVEMNRQMWKDYLSGDLDLFQLCEIEADDKRRQQIEQ